MIHRRKTPTRNQRRQLALQAAARRAEHRRTTEADRADYLRWRATNNRLAA